MKTILRNKQLIGAVPLLLFIAFSLFFSSCKKEGEGGRGAPQITGVRLHQAGGGGEHITGADPGTYIVIEGNNLEHVKMISFNEQAVAFDPMLNKSGTILVQIPAKAAPNPAGTITVTTAGGTVTYNFAVTLPPMPPPVIINISNENPMPGETVTITGEYLSSVTAINLPEGTTGSDIVINEEGTQLTFTAPGMGTTGGKLELVSVYGNVETVYDINLFDGRNVISNFDEKNTFTWPANQNIRMNDATLFPGNRGYYARNAAGQLAPQNMTGWDSSPRGSNYENITGICDVSELSQPAGNYALKFEVNTRKPWGAGVILFILFNKDQAIVNVPTTVTRVIDYKPWLGTPNNVFNTGNKWVTCTIPLDQFKGTTLEGPGSYYKTQPNDNSPQAATLSEIVNATGGIRHLQYRVITRAGSGLAPEFEAAFDNFRIVKIK